MFIRYFQPDSLLQDQVGRDRGPSAASYDRHRHSLWPRAPQRRIRQGWEFLETHIDDLYYFWVKSGALLVVILGCQCLTAYYILSCVFLDFRLNSSTILGSGVDVKGCVKVLREARDKTQSESLLNALRYTTKNLNSDTTPKNIRSLLEA